MTAKTSMLVLLSTLAFLVPAAAASAATAASPGFTISSDPEPTHFSPTENAGCLAHDLAHVTAETDSAACADYRVTVTDTGSAAIDACTVAQVEADEKQETEYQAHKSEYEGPKKAEYEKHKKEAEEKGIPYLPYPPYPPELSSVCPKGSVTAPPVTITDTLPAGVTLRGLTIYRDEKEGEGFNDLDRDCGVVSSTVVRCTLEDGLAPDEQLQMHVYVTVTEGAEAVAEGTRLTNRVNVSGGGAATVSAKSENEVSSTPAPFGMTNFDFFIDGLNGAADTQAGDHPYELVTTFEINSERATGTVRGNEADASKYVEDAGRLRDVVVDLPLGFVGSTLSAPECALSTLSTPQGCAQDTIVGYIETEPHAAPGVASPIYNLVPERGHPAEFGYIDLLNGAHVIYTQIVPTPQGYVLQASSTEIPEINLRRITLIFYGDPAEKQAEQRQHKREVQLVEEGRSELEKKRREHGELSLPFPYPVELEDTHVEREHAGTQVPFFTNPSDCSGGPVVAKAYVDSWEHPGTFNADGTPNVEGPGSEGWLERESESPPVTGCNTLAFSPELEAQPTTHEADKPTGLSFGLKVPQSEVFGTSATPDLKNLTVTFPPGMTVDPSSADGLGTCSEEQIGYQGPTLFDFSGSKPECPESSKIGELELETPLIPGKIVGEVFLAAQDANPFGSTFAIYVVVNDPVPGVVIKIAGELKSNENTGQLTSFFPENPQLPFSVLQVHFFGGPRAELATPPGCGIYSTHSELEPWSFEGSDPLATPFDSYTIDENCAIGFNPAFTGGSTNLQAGAYTTFQASFERQDNDQELGGAEVNLPPGMLADVPSVTECGEAELKAEEADAPTGGCPASSKVGTVQAGAGPGPNPLFVPGNVFWTGPHNGGPFGLAVVVSANPGPFHFGNVLVRQSIRVNPFTAAVTDVSDPFPTYLDPRTTNSKGETETTGIPIKLRRVDIEINRPGFTFNPTNCAKETFKVGGAISSVDAASKTLSTPFQVTNCAHLKFAPKFAVSTAGHTSKALGASLTAKVSIPSAPEGTYANIARVKVDLPLQLPSQLKTLQKACPAKVFEAGFEGCLTKQYEDSKIGEAVVHTPILGVPLSGPAIFVSHGGEAFPSLTIVLQGDGITIDLVGSTFIHAGITSTTFKTVPDTPFSTFELKIPQGKYAALAANLPEKDKGNLCGQNLKMPTEFLAQNGAKINEDTQIAITGCKKAKKVKKKRKVRKK